MDTKYQFTVHALERVHGEREGRQGPRTVLTKEDLLEILNRREYYTIRRESGSKVHHLFYSPEDRDWFVLICNSLEGAIITILPRRMYPHRITEDLLNRTHNQVAPSVYVTAIFERRTDGKITETGLGSIHPTVRMRNLGFWAETPAGRAQLESLVSLAIVPKKSACRKLRLKLNKQEEIPPVTINWKSPE